MRIGAELGADHRTARFLLVPKLATQPIDDGLRCAPSILVKFFYLKTLDESFRAGITPLNRDAGPKQNAF